MTEFQFSEALRRLRTRAFSLAVTAADPIRQAALRETLEACLGDLDPVPPKAEPEAEVVDAENIAPPLPPPSSAGNRTQRGLF